MAEYPASGARGRLPALRYETDGFILPEARIMGRQSAGVSFLRAFVAAAGRRDIIGVGPNPKTGDAFQGAVRALSAQAQPRWMALEEQRGLAAIGALHLPIRNSPATRGCARASARTPIR